MSQSPQGAFAINLPVAKIFDGGYQIAGNRNFPNLEITPGIRRPQALKLLLFGVDSVTSQSEYLSYDSCEPFAYRGDKCWLDNLQIKCGGENFLVPGLEDSASNCVFTVASKSRRQW
ncbi:hypothetical protein CAOG_05167 [Capsaspora owczarzaki ATCC 30864]|uniref:Uncharacterized protein n=1 Tax=Capsaspora owczarzaki (strain ATCC 30864) TaxID=595528 RepID=A0A0D2WRJ8_CAPO3|nr:hypothetical protein CAOG_05167 [Capsaspora owczarzaki ATCC 30864]KJE94535.1 hypothetical protein CAOG_005167 [Capsaspora owczarzaki ATCC 30864]|eukprot:XP_004346852.1 hypothetical protein CAOG_05167 [Capsaspora owczarzaki ATCC 30864]